MVQTIYVSSDMFGGHWKPYLSRVNANYSIMRKVEESATVFHCQETCEMILSCVVLVWSVFEASSKCSPFFVS
jgi:hypothetical protein